MKIKLYDAELKVMEIIWNNEEITAKHIADILQKDTGWNKTTTYTLIHRCISKGAIERSEPHFICKAAIKKSEVQANETKALLDKLFDGVPDQLILSLAKSDKNLTAEKLKQLLALVDEME